MLHPPPAEPHVSTPPAAPAPRHARLPPANPTSSPKLTLTCGGHGVNLSLPVGASTLLATEKFLRAESCLGRGAVREGGVESECVICSLAERQRIGGCSWAEYEGLPELRSPRAINCQTESARPAALRARRRREVGLPTPRPLCRDGPPPPRGPHDEEPRGAPAPTATREPPVVAVFLLS